MHQRRIYITIDHSSAQETLTFLCLALLGTGKPHQHKLGQDYILGPFHIQELRY